MCCFLDVDREQWSGAGPRDKDGPSSVATKTLPSLVFSDEVVWGVLFFSCKAPSSHLSLLPASGFSISRSLRDDGESVHILCPTWSSKGEESRHRAEDSGRMNAFEREDDFRLGGWGVLERGLF